MQREDAATPGVLVMVILLLLKIQMPKKLKIRKATISESELGFTFLKEAASWLNGQGIDYWQNWHSPSEHHKEWILEGFRLQQFYFVEEDDAVVGMFRLQESDPVFWGDARESAFYIHSLTTKRNLAGQAYGYRILEMIEELAKVQKKEYLRLDCGSQVKKLCAYYMNYGFQFVREVIVDGYEMNLYEKPVR